MKIAKFLLIIAATFMLGIFYLLMTTQHPLDQQYDTIVEEIMEKEAFPSKSEISLIHPELEKIKVQIQAIKKLQNTIYQASRNPSNLGKEQNLTLINQIKQLEKMQADLQLFTIEIMEKKEILP
ncbi:MAG: hypothetical protein AAF705_02985 [Bacteroidota bacterium]